MRQYSSALDLCKRFCESIKGALQSVDILVTNEYFWGKVPCSEDIIGEMRLWSFQLPNTILCTNFLLKNDTEIPDEKIKEETASLRKRFIPASYNKNDYSDRFKDPVRNKLLCLMESGFFNSEEPSFIAYLQYLDTLSSIRGSFKNESIIFFQGKPMTFYDKGTYAEEQESLLSDHFYKFGHGRDIKFSDEANIIHQYISTQICRDLVAGIRTEDNGNQRFHILQSNTIPFNGDAIPINVQYVIHANFGSPGAIYRKTPKFSSIPSDKNYVWDPVGAFDFHISFKIGTSVYNVQTLTILPR